MQNQTRDVPEQRDIDIVVCLVLQRKGRVLLLVLMLAQWPLPIPSRSSRSRRASSRVSLTSRSMMYSIRTWRRSWLPSSRAGKCFLKTDVSWSSGYRRLTGTIQSRT